MGEEPKRYYTKGHDKKYSDKFDSIDWSGHISPDILVNALSERVHTEKKSENKPKIKKPKCDICNDRGIEMYTDGFLYKCSCQEESWFYDLKIGSYVYIDSEQVEVFQIYRNHCGQNLINGYDIDGGLIKLEAPVPKREVTLHLSVKINGEKVTENVYTPNMEMLDCAHVLRGFYLNNDFEGSVVCTVGSINWNEKQTMEENYDPRTL